MIRRLVVQHKLAAPKDVRAIVDSVHNEYANHCPLFRTLHRCIEIKTSWELVPESNSD